MSVAATVNTTTQQVAVTVNPTTREVAVTVSNARGAPGINSVTSATTSDGTADLDLLNVDTVTATVSDTLTANHIHGNLAGNVYAHVRAGETLTKGDPVYVSGSHGSGSTLISIVSKAAANNAAKMPAIGIMDADLANNANGHMVIVGTITELNTAGLTVNAELYVAAGGGLTGTPPTARAQPVARVERVNANNGAIIVKVNGLSASDATGNTLVRRTSGGDASFNLVFLDTVYAVDVAADYVVASNYVQTNDLTVTNAATFNATTYTYGMGAASAHRTALGLGTGDSPTFAGATFATGSIATSQPLALTQTWTNAAVTYTGLQVNVTDTASNAASLLIDLQADGLSKFRVKTQPSTGSNSGGFLWEADTSGGVFSINGAGNLVTLGAIANHDISLSNDQVYVFRSAVGGGLRIGSAASVMALIWSTVITHAPAVVAVSVRPLPLARVSDAVSVAPSLKMICAAESAEPFSSAIVMSNDSKLPPSWQSGKS